ncbi:potassium/proton antiporter [Thermomonospora catenispora]|uniref:potassium/proton antiporter n=1 Tax=Thermomonospora catenispora TaxID=2493090 RepID=UPI00111E562C|nr:potassium/proton antiporter [Thermomonospora catenispora]TNY37295.1 potassium/proton antiporter [Thermomonospora catenispora]
MRLDIWLLVGAALVLAAILAVRVSHRLGLPSLLAYLGLGLLIGESGFGIRFDDAELAQTLGWAALVLILVEGGLTTDWRNVRPAVPVALALATVGIAVSVVVVAVPAHLLLGLDWQLAFLLGAVLAPTDAAAVFSVLRRLPISSRLVGILEAESGFNDAPVVLLVVLLSTTGEHGSAPWALAGLVVYELAVGAAVGLAVAWLGTFAVRRAALPASGLYPIAVLSLAVGSYGAATLIHSSGFMACYLCALVLGNARLPHRPATRGFAEGIAWLAQIGLFVMLGLLASPSELPGQIVPALIAGSILVLVARPLSVWASTMGFGLKRSEKVFLSWAGLRGAVPVVFATVPMSEDVPGADRLFALVFVIVVVFTLLQGPTLPPVARRLGVIAEGEAVDLDVEAAPLEELKADLLEVRVPQHSRLAGVEIFELRLPPGASVTLVVREGRSFVPEPTTILRGGDTLLVVTTADVRHTTERRLRAVSRRGKLAGWFGETGE